MPKYRFFISFVCLSFSFAAYAQPGGGGGPISGQQSGDLRPPTKQELEPTEIPYAKRIKMEYLDKVYIPKDLADAHARLDILVDEKSKASFKAKDEETAWRGVMYTVGLWIIKKWSLYQGSRIGAYLKTIGVYHPEDQAAFLLITWHRKLNGKDLGVADLVKLFKDKRKKEHDDQLRDEKVVKTYTRPARDTTQAPKPKQ